VKPNHLGPLAFLEVAAHSIAYLTPQGVEVVSFGKDRSAQSAGGVATFWRVFN